MTSKDPNFHILDENENFVVGYIFEDAYLINNIERSEVYLGDFYGDPTCALISLNNDWCFVGGSVLSIWKKDGSIDNQKADDLYWIVKVRQSAGFEVEILVDRSWGNEYSVWRLNVLTLERYKIKDLIITGEYSEKIDW